MCEKTIARTTIEFTYICAHISLNQLFTSLCLGAVKRLIDANMKKRHQAPAQRDDVYRECVQHLAMARDNSAMFWGRKEEMRLVEDYVNDRLSGAPLVLYGHAGVGKTTVISKALSMVCQRYLYLDTRIK